MPDDNNQSSKRRSSIIQGEASISPNGSYGIGSAINDRRKSIGVNQISPPVNNGSPKSGADNNSSNRRRTSIDLNSAANDRKPGGGSPKGEQRSSPKAADRNNNATEGRRDSNPNNSPAESGRRRSSGTVSPVTTPEGKTRTSKETVSSGAGSAAAAAAAVDHKRRPSREGVEGTRRTSKDSTSPSAEGRRSSRDGGSSASSTSPTTKNATPQLGVTGKKGTALFTQSTKDVNGKSSATSPSASNSKAAAASKGQGTTAQVPRLHKKGAAKRKGKGGLIGRLRRSLKASYMNYVNYMVMCPCYQFPVYSFSMDIAKLKPLFTSLGLSERDVGVFFVFFRRIDLDNSGSITIMEMLDYLGLDKNDFTVRAFSIFDEDGSGSIDFREFVISMWNYSTLNRASLVLFTFDLYDNDGSGMLEIAEIKMMLSEVYGSDMDENVHAKHIIIDLHEKAGAVPGMPVYMNVNEFGEFCRKHPAMLMPAFMFQDTMRNKICGSSFWDEAQNKRLRLSNGEYVPVGVLLQSLINDNVARSLISADQAAKEKVAAKGKKGSKGKEGKGGKKASNAVHDSAAINFMKNVGGVLATRRRSSTVGVEQVAALSAAPGTTARAAGGGGAKKVQASGLL